MCILQSPAPVAGEDAMSHGVVLVTPAPRHLRAGAVWVTIDNWRRSCSSRWGRSPVVTPDGELTEDDIRRATLGSVPSSSQAQKRLRALLPPVAGTALKDLRARRTSASFDRAMSSIPIQRSPLFVWQHHDLFQRAGFTLARRYGCPLVLFVDAPVVWEAKKWGVRRPGWEALLEHRAEYPQFRQADLVACVTEEVADAAISRGADPHHVIVTPCTADQVRSAALIRDYRSRLGIGDRVVIGWVGSFREFHAADEVIRAAAYLQTTHRIAVLMVGDGPTRRHCEELARSLGLQCAIFPGSVPHDQIPEFMAAMDLAVIPSRSGADFHYSPLKLKEYLAAGLPVVAPALGEMQRVLNDGFDALLYIAGSIESMTASLDRLVEDEKLRRSVGWQGRATYDRLFTMDTQLDEISARLNL